jgi:hypothetical protein
VRLLLGLLLTLTLATFLGLGGTWYATTRGVAFGSVKVGPWTAAPRAGTLSIEPYTRASIARTGELPMASGDGVAFTARTDDSGKPLDGRCEVAVSGTTPLARYWTLTLYDTDGQPVANPLNRFGFTSQEIVRRNDGTFQIVVAPRARPGNWLPVGAPGPYVLVLRLYDTPVGLTSRAGREMPSIGMGACP